MNKLQAESGRSRDQCDTHDSFYEKRNFVSERPYNFIFITYINTYEILNHFTLKKPKGAIFLCNHSNSDLSRVKLSCSSHAWRYHVFAQKLTWYFIGVYIINTPTDWVRLKMAPNKNSHIFVYLFSYKVNVLFLILNTLMVQG